MNDERTTTNWPEELDALQAAPQHHKLLFENDFVRVIDACIPEGEITEIHIHQWPASLYIISWSDFIRYDAEGNVVLDSRNLDKTFMPSTAIWSEPLIPRALKNIGGNDLKVICVEIKK
jgi:hypothetical protein